LQDKDIKKMGTKPKRDIRRTDKYESGSLIAKSANIRPEYDKINFRNNAVEKIMGMYTPIKKGSRQAGSNFQGTKLKGLRDKVSLKRKS